MSSRRSPAAPSSLDRASLAAAHDRAAKIGPQPGILAAALLPPLPFTPDMLAAQAALDCSSLPSNARWVDMPVLQVDPRAPWRLEQSGGIGSVQRISSGCVVIRGVGEAGGGWKATLVLNTASGEEAVCRDLVYSKSGRLVRFDSRTDAESALQPMINADGVPLRRRAWEGLPSGWVPQPYDGQTGTSVIEWRGRTAKWTILDFHRRGHMWVQRNRVWVTDPGTGRHREFPTARAARH
jgi:hypothetical protein